MKFGVGVIGATGYIGTPYRSEIRQSPDDARIISSNTSSPPSVCEPPASQRNTPALTTAGGCNASFMPPPNRPSGSWVDLVELDAEVP